MTMTVRPVGLGTKLSTKAADTRRCAVTGRQRLVAVWVYFGIPRNDWNRFCWQRRFRAHALVKFA